MDWSFRIRDEYASFAPVYDGLRHGMVVEGAESKKVLVSTLIFDRFPPGVLPPFSSVLLRFSGSVLRFRARLSRAVILASPATENRPMPEALRAI